MVFLWRHFLVEDIFDVIGPVGIKAQCLLDGRYNRGRSIFIFKRQYAGDIFLDRHVGCEQALQVSAGLGAQGGKGGDLPVVPQSFFEFFHLLPVGRSFDAAVSLPAAVVDGNLFFIVIKGEAVCIGLEGELFTDGPRWGSVGVAIEANRKIFVHFELVDFAAIGQKIGQAGEFDGFKALSWPLAGALVKAHIGHRIEPVPELTLNIG